MLLNIIKNAIRKALRDKSFSLINVFSLSLSISCIIIIYLIITHELSFDNYHLHKDRIYRINTVYIQDGQIEKGKGTQMPLAPAIRKSFSDLTVTTILYQYSGLFSIQVDSSDKRLFKEEEGVAFVEPEFFEMFDYTWYQGSPSSLNAPYSIVLSKNLADKFYPNQQAVGRILKLDNIYSLKVVGITDNPPVNTDFPFTAMVSYSTIRAAGNNRSMETWDATSSQITTFIKTPDGFDEYFFKDQLNKAIKPQLSERYRNERSYELQPLSDIHSNPETGAYTYTTGKSQIWAIGIMGILLIIASCINFINLATAQALSRAKEIGVYKTFGASRIQLIGQFICETFLLTLIAGMLSVFSVVVLIPVVNDMFQFRLCAEAISEPSVLAFYVVIIVVVTFGSGVYPSVKLSGYDPINAIRSQSFSKNSESYWLRKSLVLFQFIIVQALIIGTLAVYKQMNLLQKTDLGFNKDAVLTCPIPVRNKLKLDRFRNELLKTTSIKNVSFGFTSASSNNHWTTIVTFSADNVRPTEIEVDVRAADEYYIPTYGMTLLAGRNITQSDTFHETVVNEVFVEKMGFTNPFDAVGKTVNIHGKIPVSIVGVVKNFNTWSLHNPIMPIFISPRVRSYQMASIKIDMNQAGEAIEEIRNSWINLFPDHVFEYKFLDETIEQFYKSEVIVARFFTIISVIAITISCLGLFGLITFMANRRTKEIGIRKVLGASVTHILSMLGKEYVLLILAAFMIATPLMYFIMTQWLGHFAYKTTIGADIFIFALVLTTGITMLTIGYRALRAATADPVKSLRYE